MRRTSVLWGCDGVTPPVWGNPWWEENWVIEIPGGAAPVAEITNTSGTVEVDGRWQASASWSAPDPGHRRGGLTASLETGTGELTATLEFAENSAATLLTT